MHPKDMTDEQAEARSLRKGVEARIRRLRDVIDRIETEALADLARAERGQGRYSAVAEVFVKELPQGIVNAGIEQLVYYAAIADVYHAEHKMNQERESRA